jgi:hypothetical protein
MKAVAYLRISTGSQDSANQKLAVLDYARQKPFAIDRFIGAQASSRKGRDQRRIEELLGLRARPEIAKREPQNTGTAFTCSQTNQESDSLAFWSFLLAFDRAVVSTRSSKSSGSLSRA